MMGPRSEGGRRDCAPTELDATRQSGGGDGNRSPLRRRFASLRWPGRSNYHQLQPRQRQSPARRSGNHVLQSQRGDSDVLERVADRLDQVAERCGPAIATYSNPAKNLAAELAESLPVIWTE